MFKSNLMKNASLIRATPVPDIYFTNKTIIEMFIGLEVGLIYFYFRVRILIRVNRISVLVQVKLLKFGESVWL